MLCYVDESDHGDFCGFAAVMANEIATRDLTASLNQIMSDAIFDFGVKPGIELHANLMFHGNKEWKGIGLRARVAIYEAVIDAVLAQDVTILARSISRSRLRAKQAREHYPVNSPVEDVCVRFLLQRVEAVGRLKDQFVLVIADERNDRERHRAHFARYQSEGTPGEYMHTRLPHLLDTVHFVPSHHSRMVQAADLIAFLYRRYETMPDANEYWKTPLADMWRKMCESEKLFDPGIWPV